MIVTLLTSDLGSCSQEANARSKEMGVLFFVNSSLEFQSSRMRSLAILGALSKMALMKEGQKIWNKVKGLFLYSFFYFLSL